jgi:hypothetical protein
VLDFFNTKTASSCNSACLSLVLQGMHGGVYTAALIDLIDLAMPFL